MDKKYELIQSDTPGLYQIRALRDFGNVRAGDLGGYVASEANLSHEGNCWIYGNAKISGDARVYGDAEIYENARISENARVYGDAEIFENARISGNAKISGDARISGSAEIFENARISGSAKISGNAEVFGNAKISGDARVSRAYTKLIQIQGSKNFVTIQDTFIQIGCQGMEYKDWLLRYQEIGKAEGYTEEQIVEYLDYIKLGKPKRIKRTKKETK